MTLKAKMALNVSLALASLAALLTLFAAWVTHIVVCIKTASWALLFIGAVIAPVGIIHGIGAWFGVF